MALRLQALHAEVTLLLSEQPVVLGRSRELSVSSTSVSRHACSCFRDGKAAAKIVAAKRIYVRQKGSADAFAVTKDDTLQIGVGDIVYLAATGASNFQYGFQLLGPDRSAGATASNTAQEIKKEQPSTHCQQPPHDTADSGCFAGNYIVFWTCSHTAMLKRKAAQAGAILEDRLTQHTQLVVAARDTSAADAAVKLADLPTDMPLLSKKWEGRRLNIPSKVNFVVPQYISDCLVQNCILPTNAYLIAMQQVATKDTRTYSHEQAATDSNGVQEVNQLQPDERGGFQQPQLDEAVDEQPVQDESGIPEQQEAPAATASIQHILPAMQHEPSKPAETAVCPATKQLGIYPAIDPKARPFTGGHTGIPWGTGGEWEEPWDRQNALDTIRKLERHWYQLDGNDPASGPSGEAAEPVGGSASDDEGPPRKQLKASVNKVCPHVACSAQPVCLVEQLQTVRSNYRGRVDQFRIKAVERAISELTQLQLPLAKESDVAGLTMGARSKEKVLEIIQTGTLRRNEMLADDLEQQTIQLFLKVWGAAEATCQRWYTAGCRTLDDLRQRPDLTEQQVAGLKYFDDMQQRIPRAEVEQVHGLVCATVREVLAVDRLPDADRLHCRVTGSYIRGKPMTGDIDFLIMPPPSREPVACGAVLQALLARLLQQGLLLDEMSPSRPRPRDTGSATWLGLCKPVGSPYVRRIDFKVYPARYIAFAVNYFVGSGPFVRALRYWARTATTNLAQSAAPSSNGFKLTDTVLVPLIRQPKQRLEKGQVKSVDVLVPPGVECDDETQIFEALGLKYVPPYMRYFGINYQ